MYLYTLNTLLYPAEWSLFKGSPLQSCVNFPKPTPKKNPIGLPEQRDRVPPGVTQDFPAGRVLGFFEFHATKKSLGLF